MMQNIMIILKHESMPTRETEFQVCIIFVDVIVLYWIITKGKRELIDRIVGDFLYLNHDEYNDLEIWRDSL